MTQKEIAQLTLGENYFNAYSEFFRKAFESTEEYVAFIARRCSCAAYMFYQFYCEEEKMLRNKNLFL